MSKLIMPDFESMGEVTPKKQPLFNRPVHQEVPTAPKDLEEIETTNNIENNEQEEIQSSNVVDIKTASQPTNKKSKKAVKKNNPKFTDYKYYYGYDEDGEVIEINTGLFVENLVQTKPAISVKNEFYVYSDGFYKRMIHNEILSYITRNIEPRVRTTSRMNDILNQWTVHYKVYRDESEVNVNPFRLNLINGIYDLSTNTFTEGHSSEELMTYRIKANYTEGLTKEDGQAWHKYLNFALPNRQTQMVLQEIMGYCITSFISAKKFFVFHGKGDSGKSKVIELLESFLDSSNVSHIKLQEMHGFHVAGLYNKLLNTFADLDARRIPDSNLVKVLSGDDEVEADIKHVQEKLKFKNKAKMLFSVNDLPEQAADAAFFNRLMIIPFKYNVKPHERDEQLGMKFQKEKDYVFMWMLEGLKRLIANGFVFTQSDEITSAVENYKLSGDNVAQFIKEYCTVGKGLTVTTDMFVEMYKRFCIEELELDPESDEIKKRPSLFKELEKYGVKKFKGNDNKNALRGITYGKRKVEEEVEDTSKAIEKKSFKDFNNTEAINAFLDGGN